MKNKKLLAVLAIALSLSCTMSACSFFGGDEPDEVVEVTPTPTPTPKAATPTPKPTISADAQSTVYTSKNKSLSIKLPDATWSNKTDEDDLLSFESPDQGKILILHGKGDEDMSVAVIPTTQDTASALQKAADLVEGTDFEIQNYTSSDVNGIGVYSYNVKLLTPNKSGGYVNEINKYIANDDEYYSITASVKDETKLAKIQEAVNSFQILKKDSALKPAATGTATGTNQTGTAGTTTGGTDTTTGQNGTTGTTSGTTGTTSGGSSSGGSSSDGNYSGGSSSGSDYSGGSSSGGTSYDDGYDYDYDDSSYDDDYDYGDDYGAGYVENSAGFSQEALRDTNQTRTIYRNSDGHPIVITPNGDGSWSDFDGNVYEFYNDEDVYDQDGVDYYYHGEGAIVYYMPVE